METIKDAQDPFAMTLLRATHPLQDGNQEERKESSTADGQNNSVVFNRAFELAKPVPISKPAKYTITRGPRTAILPSGKMFLAGEFGGCPVVYLDAKYLKGRHLDIWRIKSIAARYQSCYIEKSEAGYFLLFDSGLKGQIGAFACYKFFRNRNIKSVGTKIKAELYGSRLQQAVQRELDCLRQDGPEAEELHLLEVTPQFNPLPSGRRGPAGKVYTNSNDPRGEKRIKQAGKNMSSKLRRLEAITRHSYQGTVTQADLTRSYRKKKYDAIKNEHRAVVKATKSDVANQQNADLPFLEVDTTIPSSVRVELESPEVSWASRYLKSFQDMGFFLFRDTWTSPLVTLPDSEEIFLNAKGTFSLRYPDQHPELVERWPIDPSAENPLAGSIFVASKYVAVRGDLRQLISTFCKIAGLPEPFRVRVESRGTWLFYQITGHNAMDEKTRKLFDKVVKLGTMVPISFKGAITTFNFKLAENRGPVSRPGSKFDLISSKAIVTDYRVALPQNRSNPIPTKPQARNEEKFQVVDGPIFPLVNGIPYLFIPKIHSNPHLAEPWEVRTVYLKVAAQCGGNVLWVKGNKFGIYVAFIDYEKAEYHDGALLKSKQYLSHVVWGQSEFHSRVEGVAFNN